MEKEAATEPGAPSGWPQKGSSRPPNYTIRRPQAAVAAHRTADLGACWFFFYVFYLLCEIKGCSPPNMETVERELQQKPKKSSIITMATTYENSNQYVRTFNCMNINQLYMKVEVNRVYFFQSGISANPR